MNFEIVDNLLQICVLFLCSAASLLLAVKRRSKNLIMLALAYGSFGMGTLYWVLHIAIIGDVPQIFYIAEISWIASYFFTLSMQISRCDGVRISFSPIAVGSAGIYVMIAAYFQLMAPFWLIVLLFTSSTGVIMYLSVYKAVKRIDNTRLDICLAVMLVLQLSLYIVSRYMSSFTEFNLYFAVDFALTASFCALLPLTLAEDLRK